MKSMAGNAGNVKMKGRLHKLMSCGCCVCSDFRQKYNVELMTKEIESYTALDLEEQIQDMWEDHKKEMEA